MAGKATSFLLPLVVMVSNGCGPSIGRVPDAPPSSPGQRTEGDTTLTRLLGLYADRDYFALSTELEALSRSADAVLKRPELHLLRAAVATAFNDPAESNRHLRSLERERGALADSLRVKAGELELRNHLQLFDYEAAWRVSRSVVAMEGADSATRADVANVARAMEVLRDVQPQTVVSRSGSQITREARGRIPVTVGDSVRAYAMDTGANFSVLMGSEAESLGLEVREAGMRVGTATGMQVTADVAVASRLRIGRVHLANVVFLVLPDEALTFGEFTIPGLIGFPVMDALGEVEFRPGGVLWVPEEVPDRRPRNLALPSLTPIIKVGVQGHDAVCEFDTGAGTSSLYLPFYQRHRAWIEAEGHPDTVKFAGAGGERRIPAYILSDAHLAVADTSVTLQRLAVYTESVKRGGEPEADCRLGLDAIASFNGYLINLRSMTFLPL